MEPAANTALDRFELLGSITDPTRVATEVPSEMTELASVMAGIALTRPRDFSVTVSLRTFPSCVFQARGPTPADVFEPIRAAVARVGKRVDCIRIAEGVHRDRPRSSIA